MASGNFNVSSSNKYVVGTVTWSSVTNVNDNSSTVTATLRASRTNSGYTTYGSGAASIVINGVKVSAAISPTKKITQNSNTVLCSATVKVPHNSDGTKNIVITAGATIDTVLNLGSTSATVNLDSIPRATVPRIITSVVDNPLGSQITISTASRASESFTHSLSFKYGDLVIGIAENVTKSFKCELPMWWANQVPNALQGVGQLVCTTYNGNTKIGTKSIDIEFTVPENVVPEITSITLSDPNGFADTYEGYIQNKSKLKVNVESKGSYNSTIKSTLTGVFDYTTTNNPFTSNVISNKAGEYTINVTVVDSRGRTATTSRIINVLGYSTPNISKLNAIRCNSDGTPNDAGAYTKISYTASITALNNHNSKTFKLEYRKQNEESWTVLDTYSSGYTYSGAIIAEADTESGYEIKLTATDDFKSQSITKLLSTSFTMMDFNANGTGMAIGRVSEKNSKRLEVGIQTEFYKGATDRGFAIPRMALYEMGTFSSSNTLETFTKSELANQGWICTGFVIANKVISSNASYISSWHWDSNTGTLSIVKTSADVYKDTKCRAILFNIS